MFPDRYIVMRVKMEGKVDELAAKAAAKLRTTQNVDLVEAAELTSLPASILTEIDRQNSFAPRNEDGSLVGS